MLKMVRVRMAYWAARLIGVPIRVADDFWLTDSAPSATLSLPDGNEPTTIERPLVKAG